jgi:hypothetical protein
VTSGAGVVHSRHDMQSDGWTYERQLDDTSNLRRALTTSASKRLMLLRRHDAKGRAACMSRALETATLNYIRRGFCAYIGPSATELRCLSEHAPQSSILTRPFLTRTGRSLWQRSKVHVERKEPNYRQRGPRERCAAGGTSIVAMYKLRRLQKDQRSFR